LTRTPRAEQLGGPDGAGERAALERDRVVRLGRGAEQAHLDDDRLERGQAVGPRLVDERAVCEDPRGEAALAGRTGDLEEVPPQQHLAAAEGQDQAALFGQRVEQPPHLGERHLLLAAGQVAMDAADVAAEVSSSRTCSGATAARARSTAPSGTASTAFPVASSGRFYLARPHTRPPANGRWRRAEGSPVAEGHSRRQQPSLAELGREVLAVELDPLERRVELLVELPRDLAERPLAVDELPEARPDRVERVHPAGRRQDHHGLALYHPPVDRRRA